MFQNSNSVTCRTNSTWCNPSWQAWRSWSSTKTTCCNRLCKCSIRGVSTTEIMNHTDQINQWWSNQWTSSRAILRNLSRTSRTTNCFTKTTLSQPNTWIIQSNLLQATMVSHLISARHQLKSYRSHLCSPPPSIAWNRRKVHRIQTIINNFSKHHYNDQWDSNLNL